MTEKFESAFRHRPESTKNFVETNKEFFFDISKVLVDWMEKEDFFEDKKATRFLIPLVATDMAKKYNEINEISIKVAKKFLKITYNQCRKGVGLFCTNKNK